MFIPVLLILIFFGYNYYFSVNFPFQDDFLLIQFIEVVSNGGLSLLDLIKELFRTFNDHKASTLRLLALVEYSVTGVLNFRFYIILVSINIVYIFYFLYRQFKKTALPFWCFLPAFFLFFHPLYHEISGWALNGMQHSFLIVFTVTAISLASKRNNLAMFGAIICCFLATFTHGNGILSFPAVVFYFLAVKDFKRAIYTSVGMFAALFIYLIGYESGQAMRLPESVSVFASCLFGFVGSVMAIFPQPLLLSAFLGFLIVAFLFFQLFKVAKSYFSVPVSLKPGMLELLSLFVFIFITGFVIATFRSWSGADSALASRFQIYSCMSIVIAYIWLINSTSLFQKKLPYAFVLGMSIFYWVYSYYTVSSVVGNKRTGYLADVYNWQVNRSMFSVPRQLLRNASFYIYPAYEKGFFKLSKPVVTEQELKSFFSQKATVKDNYQMFINVLEVDRTTHRSGDYDRYFYIVSDVLPEHKGFYDDRFLVLREQKTGRIYLKNGDPKVQARKVILTKLEYYKPGFNAFFRPDDLDSGDYDLGILDVTAGGEKSFHPINSTLHVQDQTFSLN